MKVELISKVDPIEKRYQISIGETQLAVLYAALTRVRIGRLAESDSVRMDWEILEKQFKEILDASTTN